MRKNKKKRKYQFGGIQQFQQPQQQSLVDSQSDRVDQIGTGIAGAIGPQWGALAQVGTSAAKKVRGNGMDYSSNLKATALDPFSWAKDNENAGDWAKSVFLGPVNWGQKAKRQKDRAQIFNRDIQATNTLSMIQNSGQGFAYGGKLSKKLKVVNGGSLNQISPDAVEVNADNPELTDSVELQDAFVDNNEIIDNKDRVFSDVLTTPTGKSVAREAKRLEKMKSTNSRFGPFNDMIETKLDNLFVYQEDMKKVMEMRAGQKKGSRTLDQIYHDAAISEDNDNQMRRLFGKDSLSKGKKFGGYVTAKPAYDTGGPKKSKRGGPRYSGDYVNPESLDMGADSAALYDERIDSSGYERETGMKMNWGKAANTAVTIAPNVVNAFLQRKLKGPRSPMLETDLRLDRVDPSAQLADASRAANMATRLVTTNTSQGSNLTSSVGSILAKRLAANNQIYGQNQAINAQIQGQEASLNQGVRARNTERINAFRGNQVDFANKKLQMTSENVANLSGKLQAQRREKNLMDLDRDRFSIIQARFEDLPEEMKAKYPTVFDYYNAVERKSTNRYGGMLKKRNIKGLARLYC